MFKSLRQDGAVASHVFAALLGVCSGTKGFREAKTYTIRQRPQVSWAQLSVRLLRKAQSWEVQVQCFTMVVRKKGQRICANPQS